MQEWVNGPRISKENNYNILRFMGAVAVLYGHMYVLMGSAAPVLYANEINAIGFKVLMVLSGYMITQSCIYEKSAVRYAIKRIFRLMPALIVYTLLVLFVVGPILTNLPLEEYFKNDVTWEYLYNILLNPRFALSGVFENNPYPYAVNGSLWALPIEVSLYIIIYILLKILGKLPYKCVFFTVITVLIIAIQGLHIIFFPAEQCIVWGTDWFRALSIYPYFFMGALYALTDIKKYCNVQVAFILFMISMTMNSSRYALYEAVAIMLIPYILISLGECTKPVFTSFLNGIDISYGLYLWGFVVQQILIQFIVVERQYYININLLFLLSLIITAGLAVVSWFAIEKPATKLMKKVLLHIQ